MTLLTASKIVEVFLVPNQANNKIVEEITESMLEKIHYNYDDLVAVESEGYSVFMIPRVNIKSQSTENWGDHFIRVETLMLLIFKDDIHDLTRRNERRKLQFLNHLVNKEE